MILNVGSFKNTWNSITNWFTSVASESTSA